MKTFIRVIASIALLLAATTAVYAQDVRNGNYQTVAHVRSDGTVQDGNYRTIGHVKSDGTVQDGSYRTIGHIKSDGTVQDGSYRTIGHVKGVDWKYSAALLFFFGAFK